MSVAASSAVRFAWPSVFFLQGYPAVAIGLDAKGFGVFGFGALVVQV